MFRLIAKLLYIALLIIETLISIRIVFTFIQASAESTIVGYVYKFSEYFVAPFSGIVAQSVRFGNFVVDTTALLSLIIYMVLAFIAVELMKAFTPREREH